LGPKETVSRVEKLKKKKGQDDVTGGGGLGGTVKARKKGKQWVKDALTWGSKTRGRLKTEVRPWGG